MDPSVLTGRRRVRPRASVPAAAPALRLSFGMLGFPFSEPAFATLVPPGHPLAARIAGAGAGAGFTPSQQQQQRQLQQQLQQQQPPAVHGVLHAVTQAEWAWLCRTEGVANGGGSGGGSSGGNGSSGSGYCVVEIEVEPYAPGASWTPPAAAAAAGDAAAPRRAVRALTLQGAPAALHDARRGALPSRRYLSLLRAGAAHHGVDAAYRRWLGALPAYGDSYGGGGDGAAAGAWPFAGAAAAAAAAAPVRAAGALASAAVMAAAAAPALPLAAAAQLLSSASAGGTAGRSGGRADDADPAAAAVAAASNAAMRATWAAHDALLGSLFGSGCSNE